MHLSGEDTSIIIISDKANPQWKVAFPSSLSNEVALLTDLQRLN